jgi:hypothetical protein
MRSMLLFVLPLLFTACKTAAMSDSETANDVRFSTLLHGSDCGITEKGVRVARTPSEWRELWDDHTRTRVPKPPAPPVDWESQMVVGVALGSRPSGGYGVEIQRVRMDNGAIVVEAREVAPAEGAIVPMVVTCPYRMITTDRRDGAVLVVWK